MVATRSKLSMSLEIEDLPPEADTASPTAVFQHSPTSPELKVEREPGCQPDEVYERLLPKWRGWIRRHLVKQLREEQKWMPDWQKRVRTEKRDKYFYWSALFGTHTFFMTGLPMLFFFGQPRMGRDLLHVVGLGIYFSSVAKDLVCSPRPYSPPVIRISMSTHAHEYGFPSSHSTNSVSTALLLGQWIYQSRSWLGMPAVLGSWCFLALYACSIVGGRVYTGMHSLSDILGGIVLGIGCWAGWLLAGDHYEAWLSTGSSSVPMFLIPLSLFLIHVHPEPVEDCPCFEDSIAIISVILGVSLGAWKMPGLPIRDITTYSPLEQGVISVMRITVGIGLMFAWRIVMKSILLTILPPIFRFFSNAFDFTLPTRRFYTAATDYHEVPSSPLRPIPSFVNLHRSPAFDSPDNTPLSSGTVSPITGRRGSNNLQVPLNSLHHRGKNVNGVKRSGSGDSASSVGSLTPDVWISKRKRKSRLERAHYDAEVLTKFGVYSGMGLLAGTLVELFFALVERGVFGQ